MEVCIARVNNRDILLKLEGQLVYIDGQVEHIRGLTQAILRDFAAELAAVPIEDHPGYQARLNARRAAFLSRLLGMAASEDSQDVVVRLLDHVHYDVLEFLGEVDDYA
jgi:citrate lyase gamma subunit